VSAFLFFFAVFPFDLRWLEARMAIYCCVCGFLKFRTSRLRSSDLSQLLLMRLPVRCLNCGERTYASVSQFLRLRRTRKARHRERQQRSAT
jgi:hypothetical protein